MDLKARNQNIREFFNEKIDTYDDVHTSLMDGKKKISELLKPDTKKILDLGVGTGLELIAIFDKYPNLKVTAIDITEKMLDKLKTRNFAKNIEVICGDFFEIDFGNNYDAVISSSALHHFDETDKLKLFKKIQACLKEDGLFINHDRYALNQEMQDQMLQEFLDNPTLYRHMDTPLTVDNESRLLKEAGFSKVLVYDDKNDYNIVIAYKK